jgi:hypothetical protein
MGGEQRQRKTEPEKAWVQPTRSTRTLTIIVFVQCRGIRKHRPKAFFPNTISKKERKKENREEIEQESEYRNQADKTKNRGRRNDRRERE